MASYDLDRFRRFVTSDSFKKTYVLGKAELAEAEKDDVALLKMGYRLMGKVFFNEDTIELAKGVMEQRLQERKDHIEMKRLAELEKARLKEEQKWRENTDDSYRCG